MEFESFKDCNFEEIGISNTVEHIENEAILYQNEWKEEKNENEPS